MGGVLALVVAPKLDPQRSKWVANGQVGLRAFSSSLVGVALLDDDACVRGLDRQGLGLAGNGNGVGDREPFPAVDAELAAVGDVDVAGVGAGLGVHVGDVTVGLGPPG